MDITLTLAVVTIIGTLAGIAGYFLMRRKFLKELELGHEREEELAQKAYETAVLKEIGDRIGYSLNAEKIVEIISGSLGNLLPYSTASYMILPEKQEKVKFFCNVNEVVSSQFVSDVKIKMLAAFSQMLDVPIVDSDVEEAIAGAILDETNKESVRSFFNMPILISGKIAGLINVSSTGENQYSEKNTAVLYRIAKQASEAVSRLREVLENEKARLSQAVESLADGLLMVDINYQLALVNSRLGELLGIPKSPTIFDIVDSFSGQLDLRTKMEEAIAKDEPLSPVEIAVGDKTLQVVISRVLDIRHNKPMGVVVLFHDATDSKSLERLRSEFTSMMVHELRAPLTSIKSTIEMLKGPAGVKTEDLAKYLEVIASTSSTMLTLVNDILDVAKLESSKFDVVPEEGDLAAVIIERVESFKPMAQQKNLKMTCDVAGDLPLGYFDKIRIKQVLNNLFSNAIKYTESGKISVGAQKEEVSGHAVDILVTVADTGIGIEPEQIGKLFFRFGQLASGREQAGLKSSGLGLYIAKSIVEMSGGRIWVESKGAGRGSTFHFTVPLAQNARLSKKEKEANSAVVSINKVAQA